MKTPPIGSTIRVVAARTGLTMETLRAWERRYGFPEPVRRAGSNRRLYSAEEVAKLEAIQGALRCGFRVGDVITMSLPEILRLAEVPESGTRAPLLDRLFEDLAQARPMELERGLAKAALELGALRFVTELAYPLAIQVAAARRARTLSLYHERLIVELLVTVLRTLLAQPSAKLASPRVLLVTLPSEVNSLALQMVAVYLKARHAEPVFLGGPTPPDEVAQAARAFDASAIYLTLTESAAPVEALGELAEILACLESPCPIWLGGKGLVGCSTLPKGVVRIASWGALGAVLEESRGCSGVTGSAGTPNGTQSFLA